MFVSGTHLIVDMFGIDFHKLDNEEYLKGIMEEASRRSFLTVLSSHSWKFQPTGVTAFCMLAESHSSIHTYPLEERAHIDIYTCGDGNPFVGINYLKEELKPRYTNPTIIKR